MPLDDSTIAVLKELEVCVLRLEDLIPEELQDQLVFLKGIPSTLRTYAPTVSVGPPPPRDSPHDSRPGDASGPPSAD